MHSFLRLIVLLIIGANLAFSPTFAQTASDWKRADSENFRIISSANDNDTQEITGKLENFRRGFFDLFRQDPLKSPVPTRVLILNSDSDAAEMTKIGSAKNSFLEGQDANYIVISPNQSEIDLRPVYHQYFHYLLSNHIGKSKIPVWLSEGLAQIYENFRADEDLKTFSQNSAQAEKELLRQNKLLPAEIFFNTDYYSFSQQQDHGSGVFCAQSAVLVNYLIEQSKNDKYKQFVGLIASGTPLNEALIKSFKLDLPAVERNLKIYIEGNSNQKSLAAKNQDAAPLDLNFSPLSQAEKESYIGDFLYQSNRFDEAALYSLKSLSINPSASFPRSTLGLVRLRQYQPDEAFEHLKKSLEDKDANYLTYYRYAYALSRQGMTEYGFVSNYDAETTEKMRGFLSQSIELNPDFAESYNLFAFIAFVRSDELDKGANYITKALAASPGNDWYLLRKAELDMRKENFTQARKSAIGVYRTAPNPGLRLYAQNTIQRIDSTEYQLLLARRTEKLPYSDIISEQPYSEEEIARLRAKALRESLTAALRQPAADEKRILGNIVGIDCKANRVDFTVKTGDQIIRLYAESFEMLKLMTFNSTLSKSQIGCGASNIENAVIIYKNSQESKPDVFGEIVSIEFVPKEFTFSVNK